MSRKDELIQELASLILQSEDLLDNQWDLATIVFDVAAGAVSNSGFKYTKSEIEPIIAEVPDDIVLLDDKLVEFQNEIINSFGHSFVQLLIQFDRKNNKVKLDFEFDNPSRWSITPANLKRIREELRPKFD